MNGLWICYTLEINHRFCDFYVKMDHFEAYLMVSSSVVDCKVLRMTIQFELFFLIRRQNGKCSVRSFGRFFFGMCPDVPDSKSVILEVTFKF